MKVLKTIEFFGIYAALCWSVLLGVLLGVQLGFLLGLKCDFVKNAHVIRYVSGSVPLYLTTSWHIKRLLSFNFKQA